MRANRRFSRLEEDLYLAVCGGNCMRVIQLRKSGAKCNFFYRGGTTPLVKAIKLGAREIVNALVMNESRLDAYASRRYPGISGSFLRGPLRSHSYGLRAGRNEDEVPIPTNMPLRESSRSEPKFHECDVDMRDREGMTPLMHAVQKNQVELAKILIGAGCDVNAGIGDVTPIREAASSGNLAMVRLLLRADVTLNPGTALRAAACMGSYDICRLLLEAGADVDYGGDITPLSCAVINKHENVVELLLQHQANPSAKGRKSECALFHAVSHKNVEAFQRLLPFCVTEEVPQTILLVAARKRYLELLVVALDTGIFDVNFSGGKHGETALLAACYRCGPDVVECLLQRGASVHVQDKLGRGPLQRAVESFPVYDSTTRSYPAIRRTTDISKFVTVADMLLDAGADLNQGPDPPLFTALRNGLPDVAKWLVLRGARVSSIHDASPGLDHQPRRLLEWARGTGRARLARLLVVAGLRIHRAILPCEADGPNAVAGCAGSPVCLECLVDREDPAEKCWLLESKVNPMRLESLARVAFRDHYSSGVKDALAHFHIPEKLKNFVLLEEFRAD